MFLPSLPNVKVDDRARSLKKGRGCNPVIKKEFPRIRTHQTLQRKRCFPSCCQQLDEVREGQTFRSQRWIASTCALRADYTTLPSAQSLVQTVT